MPSVDNIEEYFAAVEEYLQASLHVVTSSLPVVNEVVNQLWVDIARYGPGMPGFSEVHVPSLADFQVPPPPPPPPMPESSSWTSQSMEWVGRHPWKATGLVVGLVGAGVLVRHRDIFAKPDRHLYSGKKIPQTTERRQIVVVLGGDIPHALPFIEDLERKGYIVIASVSTPEAVEALESRSNGYVKAHVLDAFEPATVPFFLRSLSATLSRKFPLKSAGDPYVSPSSMPYIHAIVSFLTLSAPVEGINAPLEHISLQDTYLPYLTATQVTPLQVIQALLPLLRTGSARTQDTGKKSVVICLPATDARVGLPFASVQAMSAAATLRAAEVLRREIRVAATTERSESMRNINVVVVDVGTFDVDVTFKTLPPEGIYKSMEDWSASEKVIYGPAFVSTMHEKPAPNTLRERVRYMFSREYHYGIPRQPTDLSVLTDNLVGVVSGGRYGPTLFGVGLGLGRFRNWIRGERFSVGAGASTYRIASYLPSLLLDGLINLPHFLISIRNRLLPLEPFRAPPSNIPPPVTAKRPSAIASTSTEVTTKAKEETPDASEVETNSDADIESNAGDTVESSWVSLNHGKTQSTSTWA
ncbi:hypothetical protein BDN70DRAFT_867110 [Pholiota conissans]|uniref:DUF1776-domain-containing protein n=1 Tax=Pholiota conissans TaxID=109636 RepID=A0A9P5YQV2_9AGAR|nr:hypothetical protein BDN70DRAFT_867110 [Pholiota conissans]